MIVERHYDDEALIAILGTEGDRARDPHLAGCSSCAETLSSYRAIADVLGSDAVWDLKDLRRDSAPDSVGVLRAFAARLNNEDESAEDLVAELLVLPRAQWLTTVQSDGRFVNPGVVRLLVEKSEASLDKTPQEAAAMVRAAIDIVGRLDSQQLRGLAWRQYAHVLFYTGDFVGALDAVELMNIGWNYRREHLRIQQRSHYVVRQGGDQPNVVPTTASVWYYLRETDYPNINMMLAVADSIAQGAAMMTGAKLVGTRILGTAWPAHFSKPIAEAMTENMKQVGLPKWSEADQTLARAVQREVGGKDRGLDTALSKLDEPVKEEDKRGGGSDDIGDVSWNVPTVTLRFPSNIPDLPGHHWANAISMATPIAHKGAVAGAKAQAMTMLDILGKPALVDSAWSYFRNVQTKDVKYTTFLRPDDKPPIELNAPTMAKYRDEMRKYYYDPTKFKTYLEQLGIKYPTVRTPVP